MFAAREPVGRKPGGQGGRIIETGDQTRDGFGKPFEGRDGGIEEVDWTAPFESAGARGQPLTLPGIF